MDGIAQGIGMGKPNKTFLGLSVLKLLVFSLPRIGYPLFLIYLVCYAWMTLGPQKPQVNAIRQRAADRAAYGALAEIRAHRGSLTNVKMFHFANDPTDCLTQKFRNVLDGTGVLNLLDMTLFERLRRFANMRESGCADAAEAVRRAAEAGADGALWGIVDRFESFGEGVLLSGTYQLLEVPSGVVVYDGKFYENTITPDVIAEVAKKGLPPTGFEAAVENAETSVSGIRWHVRFLCFVVIVLLLPVVTITFIRAMVSKRSNRTNAMVLSVYTAVGLIAAFFMVGGSFESFVQVFFFLVGGGFAFGYNLYLMKFALKLEGD